MYRIFRSEMPLGSRFRILQPRTPKIYVVKVHLTAVHCLMLLCKMPPPPRYFVYCVNRPRLLSSTHLISLTASFCVTKIIHFSCLTNIRYSFAGASRAAALQQFRALFVCFHDTQSSMKIDFMTIDIVMVNKQAFVWVFTKLPFS